MSEDTTQANRPAASTLASTDAVANATLDNPRASTAGARAGAETALPGGFTMLGEAGTACEGDSCLI